MSRECASLKAEALSILPARRYRQSQPWIWSCSVAGSLLMFSVWYLGPIPISKGGPPGALTFWSAWRLSRPPACGISCQLEQTTPLLQNIHTHPLRPPFTASLPFAVPPPSVKLPGAPSGPNWVWSCIPFPPPPPFLLTRASEMFEMLSIATGRIFMQWWEHFVLMKGHSVNAAWKQQRLYQKVCGLCNQGQRGALWAVNLSNL